MKLPSDSSRARALATVLLPLLALAAGAGASATAQTLSGRPLRTESPATLAWGQHAVEVGAEYREGVVPTPLLDDELTGELVRLPVVRYRLGLGRAELALGGAAWQQFSPDEKPGLPEPDDESDVGDLDLWLKVEALRNGPGHPALGFALGAKMPNTDDATGLGTDESDVFVQFLLAKAWAAHELRLNLGLAILGDPLEDSSQEDLLTYGVGGRHGRRHAFLWEVWGRALSSDDARDLEESTLRLGYAWRGPRLVVDAAALLGLVENSGDWGFTLGATWLLGEPASR